MLHCVLVAVGQRIHHRVESARVIFHRELKTEQLANPLMWNSGKPLVKQELQAIVVSDDEEAVSPYVWLLVPDRLHQPDELTLVGHELDTAFNKLSAEER